MWSYGLDLRRTMRRQSAMRYAAKQKKFFKKKTRCAEAAKLEPRNSEGTLQYVLVDCKNNFFCFYYKFDARVG